MSACVRGGGGGGGSFSVYCTACAKACRLWKCELGRFMYRSCYFYLIAMHVYKFTR